jgi:translation initiation factor IF-2
VTRCKRARPKEFVLAKAKRVFEIAKELAVSSKAIVEKCQAEGVPDIVNHMSTVKLGLEQTIREWFSGTQTATAIETSEKVDLGKARKARRRRGLAEGAEAGGGSVTTAEVETTAEADESLETVQEPQVEVPAVDEKPEVEKPAEHAPVPAAAMPANPTAETVTPPAPAAHGATRAAATTHLAHAPAAPKPPTRPRAPIAPMGIPNVPDRPQVVAPVGPQLKKPQEAQLKGPRVIRIEKPEALPAPRSRRPGGPPPGPRDTGSPTSIPRSRGPARGRGVETAEPEGDGKGGAKRRSLNTRRGRSAEGLPTGPTKFSEQDLLELDARLKGAAGYLKQRRRTLKKHDGQTAIASSPAVTGGKVEVFEPVYIKDFSSATGIKGADVIKYLFRKGVMATINSAIDSEAAIEIALESDIELVVKQRQTAEQVVITDFENRAPVDVRPRPPVVTVLGHVDHGKTSLLDRIRKADVAAHEAGGITQHIGAYRVTIKGHDGAEKTVVFLDTPGHEAFTAMRARGANMTDLVVLVVAADDGVMPQTIESINHAKAANVPIIVALNKTDKPEATEGNIRRIYGQLAEQGLNPVEWGGQTEIMKTSATRGDGIMEMMEVLDYQAELLELKADCGGPARGMVIEAQMHEGRGPVARLLVQQGLIRVGDFIVMGRTFGRVRDMTDDRGRSLSEAGPATPLELSGIDRVPDAGDRFYVTDSLQRAEEIAQRYRETERQAQLATKTKVSLENLAEQLQAGQVKELRLVLKADVQGSVEVLRDSLGKIKHEEVGLNLLHAAVGGINESDVLLADASDAVIIGFNVVAAPRARELAEQRKVDIRLYRIIYELIQDVTKALEGMLAPQSRDEVHGQAEVREIFKITKVGTVAGCIVTDGTIRRNGRMRVIRDSVVVTENRPMESLRRVKEDVREVRSGLECGIRIAGFEDLKPGDKLVCYEVVEVRRTLEV